MDKSNSSSDYIKINNLSFGYDNRNIFNGLDLTIAKGSITSIMGPSGTGKSTLLKLITGQVSPNAGEVIFNNQNLATASRKKLLDIRTKMGVLFQTNALFTDLSVFDNVAYPIKEHTNYSDLMVRDLVLMKLNAVGLRGACDLFPEELSGGMARRVALARAVALDPDLIIYDEPFTGQDPISKGILVQLIKLLNDILGVTSIIVSHDVLETLSIADYNYLISDGTIVDSGNSETLNHSTNPHVEQFMHGLPDGAIPFHYPAPDYQQQILSKELYGYR
tara:strand:+ start:870 stop:1700 length:831 start_codon:yes stop_codon:yes gene_type:complete